MTATEVACPDSPERRHMNAAGAQSLASGRESLKPSDGDGLAL